MQSFEEIKKLLNEGKYKNTKEYPKKTESMKYGYISDEEKSVRWNKEQVELNKVVYQNKIDEYQKEENKRFELFKTDLIAVISYIADLKENQAEVIFNKAWEEGHSEGLEEVIIQAEELTYFITDIIGTNEGENLLSLKSK